MASACFMSSIGVLPSISHELLSRLMNLLFGFNWSNPIAHDRNHNVPDRVMTPTTNAYSLITTTNFSLVGGNGLITQTRLMCLEW